MATCMTGFQIAGTAKSDCLCVVSVHDVCVCVWLPRLCHCWLRADGWCLGAWVSLSHITHVCGATWLQRSHPLQSTTEAEERMEGGWMRISRRRANCSRVAVHLCPAAQQTQASQDCWNMLFQCSKFPMNMMQTTPPPPPPPFFLFQANQTWSHFQPEATQQK